MLPHLMKVNYSKLATEQANPRSRNIDLLQTGEIIRLINQEDRKVLSAIAQARPHLVRAVEIIVKHLKKGGRLFFTGAGTSGRLGVLEAAECPPTFNTPPSLVQAVIAGGRGSVFKSKEGAEDRKQEAVRIFSGKLKKHDVLVGIAASGVTPFVAGALETAKRKSAATILITCAKSPLAKKNDCTVTLNVGPEVITGSTRLKAGTATKLALNILTVASMVRLGKVYRNWMVDLQPKSRKLEARAVRLIEHLGGVSADKAESLLKQAHHRVKPAILMARKKLSYPDAMKKLKANAGFLESALRS